MRYNRVHQFCKVLRGTETFVICRIIVWLEDQAPFVQVSEEHLLYEELRYLKYFTEQNAG